MSANKNAAFMNRQRNPMRSGENILFQCPFIHHKSHTKWREIQCPFIHHKSHTKWREIHSRYTVRRQHLTTQHRDSTIFISNVHNKTVWTLHRYRVVHNQYKMLESMSVNWQWVSRSPASLVNTWQIFKKNIRYNLHCYCKNMSAGLPLWFSASIVSGNHNNYPLSSIESNIHGQYFSFIVLTVQVTANIVLPFFNCMRLQILWH